MFPLPLPNAITIWNSCSLFTHMLWASMAGLLLHIKWSTCLATSAWQKLSAFVCLTVDLQENCCYFGCTQCISTVYSKGNFQEDAVSRWAVVDLRNNPSGDVRSLFLAHKLLVSLQLLISDVRIFANSIACIQEASESWIHRKTLCCSGEFYSSAMEK